MTIRKRQTDTEINLKTVRQKETHQTEKQRDVTSVHP